MPGVFRKSKKARGENEGSKGANSEMRPRNKKQGLRDKDLNCRTLWAFPQFEIGAIKGF